VGRKVNSQTKMTMRKKSVGDGKKSVTEANKDEGKAGEAKLTNKKSMTGKKYVGSTRRIPWQKPTKLR